MLDIAVENIKCGGCAKTIRTRLLQEQGVSAVEVDIETGRVSIAADADTRPALVERLAGLGYPEVGSVEGIRAAAAKAKSFVSCAVGRIEKSDHSD